jgi:arsenate reductase
MSSLELHCAAHIAPFEFLMANRMSTEDLRSKSWSEFAQLDSPPLDFVITVGDNAAGEVCPVWPGQPVIAHWGVPDPTTVEGSDAAKRKAFSDACHLLTTRIRLFASLPIAKIDRLSLQNKVREIGRDTARATPRLQPRLLLLRLACSSVGSRCGSHGASSSILPWGNLRQPSSGCSRDSRSRM